MFDTYTDIFNLRGAQYHEAMMECPDARREEFEHAIRAAGVEDGHVVYDVPSGGSYLGRYLRKSAEIIAIETSSAFANLSAPGTLLCDDARRIPLDSRSADRVICLAGSHHLEDRPAFYQEVRRLLRPGGVFCLADVRDGSDVAGFLNGFVHRNNSLGHQGSFLDSETRGELEAAGFVIREDRDIRYGWHFGGRDEMVRFCQRLFGLDLADEAMVLDGIERQLGYVVHGRACVMNWELRFLTAVRPGGDGA